MFGSRARLGFIVPANNSIIEPELWSVLPSEVALYATRILATGRLTEEAVKKMEPQVDRAVAELVATGVDAIVFADMVTSFIMEPGWNQTRKRDIAERTGVHCLTAWTALADALAALKAERIVLGTPYPAAIHAMAKPYFASAGIEILDDVTLDIDEMSDVPKVPGHRVRELAISLRRDGAQAIVLLATDLPTFSEITNIEKETGLPVLTSNQTLLWNALRACGVDINISELGRLFGQ
jgi:maleate isomerase